MAGQLNTNPYLKTYDEVQRSVKRMEAYLNISGHLLSSEEEKDLKEMIYHLYQALSRIPEEFRVTKHHYRK